MTETDDRRLMAETEEIGSKQSEGLSLSVTQLVASVLAAVSSSVAASVFGVAGTVIGAALGSLVSVVGSAVYSYSLKRTQERVLDLAVAKRFDVKGGATAADAEQAAGTESAAVPAENGSAARSWRRFRTLKPKQLGIAAAALFVLTLGLITSFELLSGRPVSATVTDKQGSGVSLVGGHTSKAKQPSAPASPSSTGTSSTRPGTSNTPSDTPSATPSASPSTSDSSSSAPSDIPSASASPSTSDTAPTESAPTGSASMQLGTPNPTGTAASG
jgi:hypothetical protein